MVDVILKATYSSFQKDMTFCRSIYVMKVMKLLAFIFEQLSYKVLGICGRVCRHAHLSDITCITTLYSKEDLSERRLIKSD